LKEIVKSKLNIFYYLILTVGGIGALILGVYLTIQGIENSTLFFIGIPFTALGLYSVYWIFNVDILIITDSELIKKSITGKIKESISRKNIKSFNEIEKQNAQYKGEPAHMKWKDLTLFGENFNYKISSTTYSNYVELKREIIKGLQRNKKSEVEWNRKNGQYYGIGFTIFGIVLALWLGILPKELDEKIIGVIIGLVFLSYGIYLLNKNKKPTANNV
jgi:hypothetical protein